MIYFRTLPLPQLDKVVEKLREHKVQGLLVIGGFEVMINFYL